MYHNINLVKRDKLDLYDTRDSSHPFNTFYEPATVIFLGPVDLKKRKCTDIIWIIGFVIIVVATAAIISQIYPEIQFDRFYHGSDFRGDLCGMQQVTDKKYMYFFDPINIPGIGMCVDNCPQQDQLDYCFYDIDGVSILDDYCYKTYKTHIYLNRYCMPFQNNIYRKSIESTVLSFNTIWKNIAHDFYVSKDIIVAAFIGSIILGFIFMVTLLIKKASFVFVWIYALAPPAAFIIIFLAFFPKEHDRLVEQHCENGQSLTDCLGDRKILYDILKYILVVCSGLTSLIMIINYKKIIETQRDIQVLLAPFRMADSMKFVPFFTSIIQLSGILVVYALIIGIMSSGKRQVLTAPSEFPNPEYVDLVIKNYIFYLISLLLVILIVFLQTFYLFQKFCYSFAVQVWYFSRQKSILDRPSSRGVMYCFSKHMGTCVKGAIIMIINWIFRSIQRQFKRFLKRIKEDHRDSRWLKFWLCICLPCFHLFEYFSKYQCNLTIMHTALYGQNWADGAEKSYYLFERNLTRTERFGELYGYTRIIGSVFSSSCLFFFIYFFTVDSTTNLLGNSMDQVFYPYALAGLCALFGFYLPQNFCMSFDVVIEAMVFSLVADEEMFLGRERFCEDFILDYMNKITKETSKKGLVTAAKRDQQEQKIDDQENIDNLKPKEIPIVKLPTPPPESSSSSEEDEKDAVDLFAEEDRENEEERRSQYTEKEPSVIEPEPIQQPEEETYQFKKLELGDIKDERRDSEDEDHIQEDFGISKKKNVDYDEDDNDDIILDQQHSDHNRSK